MKIQGKVLDGNLVVEIPMEIAAQLGLDEENAEVNVVVHGGAIIIRPADAYPGSSLGSLLSGVTDDNIHTEKLSNSAPVGKEIW